MNLLNGHFKPKKGAKTVSKPKQETRKLKKTEKSTSPVFIPLAEPKENDFTGPADV